MRFPQFSVSTFDDVNLPNYQFYILAEFEAGLTIATEDSVKEIIYHDGGVDLVAFGNQRREISSTLTITNIPVPIYHYLLSYLLDNSGKYINIVMDEGELIFGADINPFSSDSRFYHSNPFSCQITSVVPKDEVFDNCFEIELTLLLQRDEVNPIVETPPEEINFLVEFNLAAFTVYDDISEDTWSVEYASYPVGATIRVYQTDPTDETTAKYFVRVPNVNIISEITEQIKTQRKRSDGTDRLLLKDVPELNLKLGVMALSTFKDYPYTAVDNAELNLSGVFDIDYNFAKPQYFKEGLIASEGVSFPDRSIDMKEAWGVEQPNGFTIKLSNTTRAHIQLIEANLNIAECSVWVVLGGTSYKYCSGLVESIVWDAVNYTITVEPRSLLELQNTIPTKLLSDVFPEAQSKDEGEIHMITYGPWAFGKLQKVAGVGIPFPKKKLSDKIGTTFSSSIIPYSDPDKYVPGNNEKVTDFYAVVNVGTEDPLVNNMELYKYCGVTYDEANVTGGIPVEDTYIKILTSPATSETQTDGTGSLLDDVYIEKEVILKVTKIQTWGSHINEYRAVDSAYVWDDSCVLFIISTEGLDYAQDPISVMKETSHLISIKKEQGKYTTDWCQQYKYQRQSNDKPIIYSWNNDSETYSMLDRDLFIVKPNGLENIILPKFDQNTTSVTTGSVIGKRFYGEWYWNEDSTKVLKNDSATDYCVPLSRGYAPQYNQAGDQIGSGFYQIAKISNGLGKRLSAQQSGAYAAFPAYFESSKINTPLISTNAVSYQTRLKPNTSAPWVKNIDSLAIGTSMSVNQIFDLFGFTITDYQGVYEMVTNTPVDRARLVDYLIAFTNGFGTNDTAMNDWCGVYLGADSSSESMSLAANTNYNAESTYSFSNFIIPTKETPSISGANLGAFHRIGANFKFYGSNYIKKWILDDTTRTDVTIPPTIYGSDNSNGINKSGKLLVAGRVLVNRAARIGDVPNTQARIVRTGYSPAYVEVPSVSPNDRTCDSSYIEAVYNEFQDIENSTHEYLTMDWVSVCHEYTLTDEIKTSFKGQSEDASIYMSQFIKMQLGFDTIDAFEKTGDNSVWDRPWEVGVTPKIMTVRIILKHKNQNLNRIVSFEDIAFENNAEGTNFGNNGFMPLYNLTGSMGGNNKFSLTEAFNASGALDITNDVREYLGLTKYPVNTGTGHQGKNKANAKMPKTPPVVFPVDELMIPKNFFNEDFDYFNECTDIIIQFGAKEWHPVYPSLEFRQQQLNHLHIYYGSYDFGGQLGGDMGIRLSKAKVDLESDNTTDLFVKIQYGRTNGTGDYNIVNTPQAQFNQLMQREDPIKPLSIGVDLAVNSPKLFNTRFQMTSSESISEILDKTAKHSMSYLIESNETGIFLEYSSYYANRNGGAVFGFDETNILRDSIKSIKQRKSSEFISKIKLSFNFHCGKDKLDTDLTVTFNPKAVHTDGHLGAFVASGIYAGKVDMNLNIDKALVNIMRIQQSYFKTRIVNEKEVTAEWFFDDKEDSNTEDSIGQLAVFFSELFYFHSQEAWDLTFTTKMDYVIHSPEITEKQSFESQNKLTLGDLVSYKSWFLTDIGIGNDYLNLNGLGFIRQISPDFYNGTVDISIFSPLPPSVLASLEADPVWDGSVGSIDMDNYTLESKAHLFTYPFKDGLNVGHPSAGFNSITQEEHQFDNDEFADQMEN